MSDIKLLEIPKWGLSMEEGTVVEWLIAEGDDFSEGQEICEIESEKIVNVLEAPFSGTLRKIIAESGDTLPVQAPIGVAAAADIPDSAIDEYVSGLEGGTAGASTDSEGESAGEESAPLPEHPPSTTDRTAKVSNIPDSLSDGPDDASVHATPRARKLATEFGINLNNIQGSGRNRRISITDVKNAMAATGAQLPEPVQANDAALFPKVVSPLLATEEEHTDRPLTGIRKTIASRLQQSKQAAPHYRLTIDCRIDSLLRLRQEFNAENPDAKVSVNDFIVKAAAMALAQVPECNIQFNGETVRQFADAHVAVAVALETGVIAPIVRSANAKPLKEIAAEISALVARTKENALKAEDIQGGTFTVSNLGMYGIKQFDAVINPPQAAIMTVGAGEERVIAENGAPMVAKIVTVTLTCDHRVIDGALGARFLEAFRSHVENPTALVS